MINKAVVWLLMIDDCKLSSFWTHIFSVATLQENLLKNPGSGKCLQLKGDKIQMDHCNAADPFQHWSFSWPPSLTIMWSLAPSSVSAPPKAAQHRSSKPAVEAGAFRHTEWTQSHGQHNEEIPFKWRRCSNWLYLVLNVFMMEAQERLLKVGGDM